MFDILTPLIDARTHLAKPGQWNRGAWGTIETALAGEPCSAYGALIWATQASAALPHALWALNRHMTWEHGYIHRMEADLTQGLEDILLAFDTAIEYECNYWLISAADQNTQNNGKI